MGRTQRDLEQNRWEILQLHVQQSGVTISDLMREAIRDRYRHPMGRKEAFQAAVGAECAESERPSQGAPRTPEAVT